jgi:hypothetical protein
VGKLLFSEVDAGWMDPDIYRPWIDFQVGAFLSPMLLKVPGIPQLSLGANNGQTAYINKRRVEGCVGSRQLHTT